MTLARWERPDGAGVYADIPLEDGLLPVVIERTLSVSIVVKQTMLVLLQIPWQRERSVEPR
jgi:hypothetical protein